MKIQDAIKKAREEKRAIRKTWWPKGYCISQNGAFLVEKSEELYRFDVESLLSEDWIVDENQRDSNAEVPDHSS